MALTFSLAACNNAGNDTDIQDTTKTVIVATAPVLDTYGITQIKNGPHSPGKYRANGIVRNFDAWYEAFDVQPGDALYLPPEKRVKIW